MKRRLWTRWMQATHRGCPWHFTDDCPNTYTHAVEAHGL